MKVSFKDWLLSQEGFVPGTYVNRTQDITNTDMGIRSKYVGPEDTGENHKEKVNTADFGFNKFKRKKRSGNV